MELTQDLTERKIKKIPYQSLGVLLMYKAGIDLQSKMSRSTYYTHKRILKAYGVEIRTKNQDINIRKKAAAKKK